ncbi:mitochondrial inner membrane protease ATP23 [Andrographis paniculata]|uniref:mitochondrial inner membrane protease ATP23 n=1 Tax=Andrographis paniculata TaxID=175694 RepID=UPI0021E6DCB9|nr:mitochondrial inner membrane protease ATP23 [Andrographis paniculata]
MAADPDSTPEYASGRTSPGVEGQGLTLSECEKMIQRSLRTPMVRFLRENIEKSGCSVGSNFIKAVDCGTAGAAGGYVRGEGITVCYNNVQFQDEVTQTITHELVHAYDECRAANLDWNNCAHHACSEIRANHVSGDCHYKRELLRGFFKIGGHEQECLRRRVLKSLSVNPNCSETAAKDAMEAVWDTCYNDTSPFDRAP